MMADGTTMTQRLDAARRKLVEHDCDAMVSFSGPDNQYLTGFLTSFDEMSSALIITADEALFLCDFRYTQQAHEEVVNFTVEQIDGDLTANAGIFLADLKVSRAAYDPGGVTVAQHRELAAEFSGTLEAVPEILRALRAAKSADEIDLIRQASALAEGVLPDILADLEPGVTEQEVAARFEYEVRRRGATGASFPPIALFGERSSLVHGVPSDRPLRRGDVMLFDFGCRRQGYCSDLTRTYVYGTIPGAWFEQVYTLVQTAQQLALDAIAPGMACRALDSVARDAFEQAGYETHFGHGLGHGVGIEIHEPPRANRHSKDVLNVGTVITIEPGVYLPEHGGVRIEDLVVVTEDGCELLSSTPKELVVVG